MARRKSKWDIPADAVANSNGNSSPNSAAEAAKERAAKLTAMLAAKGKLANNTGSILPVVKPVIGPQPLPKLDKEQDLLTAEIEINDSPSRVILCKGTTQDEISRYSGAAVSTKGRFMDAEEKKLEAEGVRPLYLCIQGTSQDKVDKAVQRIQEIMAGAGIYGKQTSNQTRWSSYEPTPPIPTTVPATQAAAAQAIPTGMHYVQDKVFVGLDSTCSPDFNVKEKLIGPAGSFFQHITTETGAKVFLRGKGSGFLEPTSGREAFEALHIYISHARPEGLSAAKKLVENLIQTVNNEYQNYEQMKRAQQAGHLTQPGYPPPMQGYMPPMGYPPRPGMPPHPLGSYPGPPGPIPPPPQGGYYRHPPPPGHPQAPPPVPYQVPPHGYGAPPQQGPPLPRGQSNGNTPNYPGYPPNAPVPLPGAPYPPRPSAPTGPLKNVPSPAHVPERIESEDQNNRKRPMPHDMPHPVPPPEQPKRRFREASRSELPQEPQPRKPQELPRLPEPSSLGNKPDPKEKGVVMPPPLMSQIKFIPKSTMGSKDEFKKPLGPATPFLVPPPPREIVKRESTSKKPEMPGNTRKHGLSKPPDSSPSKKVKQEEDATSTGMLSLVAYDGDSSEEEDETPSPTPTSSSRSTPQSKKQNLPFWAVGK